MALDFPSSPSINDTYTASGRTWKWDGTAWQLQSAGVQGPQGPTGPQGPAGPQGSQGPVGPQGVVSATVTTIVTLSQATYDALGVKDSATLYFIV